MTAMNLYQLSAATLALDARLDEAEGVADADLAAEIDKIEGAIEDTAEEVVRLIREYRARAKARSDEAASLEERATKDNDRADRLQRALLAFMSERGLKKIAARTVVVRVANNGGKAPIEIVPGAEVPADFMTTPKAPEPKPDLGKIRDALDVDPASVPFARMLPRGQHLKID